MVQCYAFILQTIKMFKNSTHPADKEWSGGLCRSPPHDSCIFVAVLSSQDLHRESYLRVRTLDREGDTEEHPPSW